MCINIKAVYISPYTQHFSRVDVLTTKNGLHIHVHVCHSQCVYIDIHIYIYIHVSSYATTRKEYT